jgi:hypothetical protein
MKKSISSKWILKLLPLTLSWVAAPFSFAASPPAFPYGQLSKGEFKSSLAGTYYDSTKNLDSTDNPTLLPNAGHVRSIHGNLHLSYGIIENLTVFSNLEYINNYIENSQLSLQNAGGPGDAEVGIRVGSKDIPVRLFADLSVQLPMYSRLSAADWAKMTLKSTAPQGTGVMELKAFGTLEFPVTPTFFLGATAGYTKRGNAFSDLFNYAAYIKYEKPRGLFAKLGVLGATSIFEDKYTGRVVDDRAATVLGGSFMYNSINPSFIKADALLGTYITEDSFVSVGGQYEVSGKNISQGPLGLVAVGVNFGGKSKDSGYTHSNKGFQQYYFAAQVVQVNSGLNLVLIDKGRSDGVVLDEYLDLFEPDQSDGSFGETIARAKVTEVGPTRSKLKVLEFYKETFLEEGIVVRRPVR